MSQLKKINQAMVNRARLDPKYFDIEIIKGERARITHRESGVSVRVDALKLGVIMIGHHLEAWALTYGIQRFTLDEYIEIWRPYKENNWLAPEVE